MSVDVKERRQKRIDVLYRQRQKDLAKLEQQLKECRADICMTTYTWRAINGNAYQPVPKPEIEPSMNGNGFPFGPGVYFVFENQLVVYVGQSTRLRARVTLRHANIRAGDVLSFLPFPTEQLNFAEAFYIGLLCPVRNFNGRGREHVIKHGPTTTPDELEGDL